MSSFEQEVSPPPPPPFPPPPPPMPQVGPNGVGQDGCCALIQPMPRCRTLRVLPYRYRISEIIALPFCFHVTYRPAGVVSSRAWPSAVPGSSEVFSLGGSSRHREALIRQSSGRLVGGGLGCNAAGNASVVTVRTSSCNAVL